MKNRLLSGLLPLALLGMGAASPQLHGLIVYTGDPARDMVFGHPVGSDRLVPISGAAAILASTLGHAVRGHKPVAVGPLFDIRTAGWLLN